MVYFMRPKMLIFGFGYTAAFLAKKLVDMNFHITGTSRTKDPFPQHIERGYDLIEFTNTDVEKCLQSATHVLVSTPPTAQFGDPVLSNFVDLIKKYAPQFQWLGYLSSTGVYGDHQGEWVDESSAFISLGPQAELRLKAEKAWLSLAQNHQIPLHIFRIAGIYGPQRNALTRIAQGKTQTIYKENHYFSRIHVQDIAEVLVASIKMRNPISIYNVADDEPASAHVVDEYAARLLNVAALERLPFEFSTLSPMAKEFYTHHRRVSNSKIKQELLVTLTYPTYREGLQDLYEAGDYSC